ncbi:MAG: hypothetical protein ABI576_19485 [Flavobacterium sp.]
MGNLNNNTDKDEKLPPVTRSEKNGDLPSENANKGDWDEEREDARTDEEGYDTTKNDNSGGAGSSGSASTNS